MQRRQKTYIEKADAKDKIQEFVLPIQPRIEKQNINQDPEFDQRPSPAGDLRVDIVKQETYMKVDHLKMVGINYVQN